MRLPAPEIGAGNHKKLTIKFMKHLGRIILAGVLAITGIGISVFGGLLAIQVHDVVGIALAVAVAAFGIALLLTGYAVAKGNRIRDILETLFLSFP